MQTATITVRGLAPGQIAPWNRARLLRREILIALLVCGVLSPALWAATAWWLGGALITFSAAGVGPYTHHGGSRGCVVTILLEGIGLDPAFSTSAVTAATDAFAYGTVLAVTTYLFA